MLSECNRLKGQCLSRVTLMFHESSVTNFRRFVNVMKYELKKLMKPVMCTCIHYLEMQSKKAPSIWDLNSLSYGEHGIQVVQPIDRSVFYLYIYI